MLTDVELMDYEEYLNNANDEEIIFINELYDQGQILEDGLRDIINLKQDIKILVITSTKCKLSGEMKLPTIMVMDSDNNVIRKFVEFPKGVKDILINTPKEETQKVIDEMRSGKYNDLIQLDLIKFITGKKYEYISFERLDK